MNETKFKIGDKVRIINYGHLVYHPSINELNKWYNYFEKARTETWFKIMFPELPLLPYKDKDFSDKVYKNYDGIVSVDLSPDLVGQEGIISDAHLTQGKATYAIEGIKDKVAWYDDEQLEIINQNKIINY